MMKRLPSLLGLSAWYAFLLLLCLAAMVGCNEKPEPKPAQPTTPQAVYPRDTPPGSTVRFEFESDEGSHRVDEQAHGTGAGLSTTSDEAAAKFNTSAPGATLPGIGSTGGSLESSLSVQTLKGASSNPLLWIGIAGIVAAGVAIYLGIRRAALICGIGGAGFIVAAMLPAWAWVVLAAVGVIAGSVYLLAEYQHKSVKDTTQTLLKTIEGQPIHVRKQIKDAMAIAAPDAVKSTIRKLKRHSNLPTERPTP